MLNQLKHPEQYQNFINDMNSIGWDQLFKIRVLKRWKAFNSQKLKRRKHDMFIVCNILWLDWKALWYKRNLGQHGIIAIEKKEKMRSDISFKLQAIYNYRQLLLSKY